MRTLYSTVFPALVIVAVLFSLQPAAQAQDPDDVLQQLQQRYEEIETLRATFTQTMQFPGFGGSETTSGTLTLQGQQYRVEMPDQIIVADGATTWIYMTAENQMLINDYEEDETTFSPTNFFLQFDERYVARGAEETIYDNQPHVQLRLVSDDPATMFTHITVWIRQDDDMVRRIDVVDVNDTEITFELDDVTLNPEVEEDVFVLTPPDDAEIIDLRV